MTRTLWSLATRSRLAILLLFASAVGFGLSRGRGSTVVNWRNLIEATNDQLDLILPALSLMAVLWMMGPDDRHGMLRDRSLQGLSTRSWRALQGGWAALIVLAWCGAEIALTLLAQSGTTIYGHPRWVEALCMIMVKVAVLTLWWTALVRLVGYRNSMILGLGAVVLGWIAVFGPSSPLGDMLRVIVPTSALRVLRPTVLLDSANYALGPVVVFASLVSLGVWSLGALCALIADGWRTPRRAVGTPRRDGRASVSRLLVVPLLISLAAGFVVPRLVTETLPERLRPALALQAMTGRAPQQRATDFLLALRTAPSTADRLTVSGSARRTLGDFVWAYASLPAGTTFELVRVVDRRASVVTNGTAHELCMLNVNDTWLVNGTPGSRGCFA